jgi:gliding motility-associated-like protein
MIKVMCRSQLKHLKSLLFLVFTFTFGVLNAQTDDEFWFAAPEVTSNHGDSPIFIRVSAFSQDADITLSQPANPNFTPINLTIIAGSTETIDLSPFQTLIENQPANQVLNKGLYLQSSVPVTAYYEVNSFVNPEIFALKGKNALGQTFYTPFPSDFNNGNYTPLAISGFEIVATEDNTTITITPTADLVTHPAGVPFTITLNRGQTYSCISNSTNAASRPIGTSITSNKPIAITLKDDSASLGGCRDLMGDQLVPTGVIGNEYIVMKGYLSNSEKAYVLAASNNTEVFIDGNATPAATLNIGEQFAVDILNPTTYITSSAPVYVLHASGFGCELGSAILPSIQCTGSSSVFFTRSTNEFFGLNIMVRPGSEGNFLLNGSTTLVPASAFTLVPGSSGEWMTAQLSFDDLQIPVGTTSSLINTSANSELFHLGIINGGNSSGCRYGYFSDFSSTYLGENQTVCINDSLLLDGGAGKDTYLWSTGDTIQQIYVYTPGEYWVVTVKDGCESSDTVTVVQDDPQIQLGSDLVACGTSSFELNPGPGFVEFLWSNNATSSTIDITTPGEYWVEAYTSAGCRARDTVSVTFNEIPPILNVQYLSPVCEGAPLTLSAVDAVGEVTWTGPANFTSNNSQVLFADVQLNQSGNYTAIQTLNGCDSQPAQFNIVVNESSTVSITGDTLICEGELATLTAEGDFSGVTWSNAATTTSIEVGPGEWTVSSNSAEGCGDTATVQVLLAEPIALFTVDPSTTVLKGNTIGLADSSFVFPSTNQVIYSWDFGDGNTALGPVQNYLYADTGSFNLVYVVTNSEGCIDTLTSEITVIGDIVVPNAFSPNGDGKNDLFKIGNLEAFKNPAIWIFNRWGKLLYSSDNYQNNWDGDENPDGTYFFVLQLMSPEKEYKGTVFLSR